MSAFRGRRHDANLLAVTLDPTVTPAFLRKKVGERKSDRRSAGKFQRSSRFFILLFGIAASWALLIGAIMMLADIVS